MAAPLVAGDVDLTGFGFYPIYLSRLFGSWFHANASDSEWRAGMTLWLKSWEQHPPGSLPNNDIELCHLAELGRDQRTWRKLKPMALHGWSIADDGRLYHEVVAEAVNEAWERRLAQRSRTSAAREARLSHRRKSSVTSSNRLDGNPPLNPPRDGGGEQRAFDWVGIKPLGTAVPAPAIDPKFLNHGDFCQCGNCTRWAARRAAN